MSSQNTESIASRYLEAAGHRGGEAYELDIGELVWLVEHAGSVGGLRLELLQALQSALHRSDEQGVVPELKQLLTDLIIMQSRLAGRDETLLELMHGLIDARALEGVSLDEAVLRGAIQVVVGARVHVDAVADGHS